jgi:ubiquinone/menaquinone biosynthesis C-methylase UbiE
MPAPANVTAHYGQVGLTDAIRSGLASLGKAPDTATIDDLAPVDEFHIGGRTASQDFLDQLELSSKSHILDVGCGLGGAARFVAHRYGCRITGIDLTGAYVETGNVLCQWVGLDQRVALHEGSALAMPFADGSFDGAYMMHVGMNIADKAQLAVEVARKLRPGALFGIYDVMRTGPGDLTFPVPWASTSDLSAVAAPEAYKAALQAAGFVITAERNRRDFALAYFAAQRAQLAAIGGPPPLGLHLLNGKTSKEKMANMIDNISNGRIAPVELIARKA